MTEGTNDLWSRLCLDDKSDILSTGNKPRALLTYGKMIYRKPYVHARHPGRSMGTARSPHSEAR